MNDNLHQTHHDQSSPSQPDETGTKSKRPTSSQANMSEVGCDVAATASDDISGGERVRLEAAEAMATV
jgi:hypothetical protein